jgi:hypothetical protein
MTLDQAAEAIETRIGVAPGTAAGAGAGVSACAHHGVLDAVTASPPRGHGPRPQPTLQTLQIRHELAPERITTVKLTYHDGSRAALRPGRHGVRVECVGSDGVLARRNSAGAGPSPKGYSAPSSSWCQGGHQTAGLVFDPLPRGRATSRCGLTPAAAARSSPAANRKSSSRSVCGTN